jgi:hypothetical protein
MRNPILPILCLELVILTLACSRSHSERDASNHNNISSVYQNVECAALSRPKLFVQSVGAGLVCSITNVPEAIRTNFFFSDDDIKALSFDTWKSPLNVRISPVHTNGNDIDYEVLVWSSGKNRINEGGKGDDIVLSWPELRTSAGP